MQTHNYLFCKKAASTNAVNVEVLTPIIDDSELHHYTERLKSAIDNNDVKNIAICGNYGSGKSSIINTFINKYKKNYIYLKISLAGFNKSGLSDKDIEHSLVQQFFYHVKYDNIPFSRFRRIRRITKSALIIASISAFLYVCSWLFILAPSLFEKFGIRMDHVCSCLRYLAGLAIASGTLYIIFLLIKLILHIGYVHLKISEYEINLNKKDNISIFNKYLDELIYLFQSSTNKKTHIVIIEDIDRLNKCPSIFTKLREINLLLNQAEDINKQIVFIYALKEDIFDNYLEKTKFFDYILSVIPKANASNAVHDFYCKFKDEIIINNGIESKTDNEFLMDVAPFIPDVRSIKCIANDYFLFKDILKGNNLDRKKLLAMVIYKNIYPVDYASLHENKGHLHEMFQNKQLLISKDEQRIKTEIEKIEAEIKRRNSRLEEERLKNTDELKALIVAEFLKKSSGGYPVDEDGNLIHPDELFSDDYIEEILHGKAGCQHTDPFLGRGSFYPIRINSEYYNSRKELFEQKYSNETESLKSRRDALLKELACIQRKAIKELCNHDPDALNKLGAEAEQESKQKDTEFELLNMMVMKGYIAEDHCFYITIFKEGMMTHNDIEFLKNIHGAATYNNRDYFAEKIDNPEIILGYMYDADFSKDDVLNYRLVNFIYASGDKYKDQKHLLVSKITSYSKPCLDFVCKYLTTPDTMQTKELLLNDIVTQDNSLWEKIVQENSILTKSDNQIFLNIVKCLDEGLFKRLDLNQSFSKYLRTQDYLEFQNIIPESKFIKIVKTLNIKFVYLVHHNSTRWNSVLDSLYRGHHYVLNAQNINFIISELGRFKYNHSKAGLYSTAMESGCTELKNYIQSNINDFVKNNYLNNNQPNEEDRYLIDLINNEKISPDYKAIIVHRSDNRLDDISKIRPQYLPEVLTADSCAAFNIKNLEYAYNRSAHKQLAEWIITYINNNAEAFSDCVMRMEHSFKDNTLATKLFLCNDIDNKAYLALLNHHEICNYFPKDFTSISSIHIELAIKSKVIPMTIANWNAIKMLSFDLALYMLLDNIDSIKGKVASFGFTQNDLRIIEHDSRFMAIHYEVKKLTKI